MQGIEKMLSGGIPKKKQDEIKNDFENGKMKENADGSVSKNDANNNNEAADIMETLF